MYRPDPHTPDVWQYKDTQDWSSDATVRKKWEQGKEMKPKGFGKGKSFGKGGKGIKGKEKGKRFGKGPLAIMDKDAEEEEGEEEEENEGLKKARKARVHNVTWKRLWERPAPR